MFKQLRKKLSNLLIIFQVRGVALRAIRYYFLMLYIHTTIIQYCFNYIQGNSMAIRAIIELCANVRIYSLDTMKISLEVTRK